jgi:hypothetical protein
MNLAELIVLYRSQSMDQKQSLGSGDADVFCKDDLLTIYANEAQDEACRRGDLLRDSSSPMCTIAIAADAETVTMDPKIVRILRARVDGDHVEVVSGEVMDGIFPGWQDDTNRARPTHLVEGMTSGALHLWPRPKVDGAIRLTVQRLPLKPLRNDNDKPEIRPELHPGLVDWMLYRAYSREDTDLHNDGKAAVALARFEAEFGRKVSGRNEQWVRNGAAMAPAPIA